ncbi:MAG: hypothetical protein HZY73_11860 [Micropruina sp.]|nr:MAG: hypothetical protein HZY73_11860 [Micropruina sp.]
MALDRTTLVTGVTVLAALAVGSAITARLPSRRPSAKPRSSSSDASGKG